MANSVLDLNWGGGFHSFLVALSGPIIGNFEGTLMFLNCTTIQQGHSRVLSFMFSRNLSSGTLGRLLLQLLSSLLIAAGQAGITSRDVYNPTIGRTLPYQVAACAALDLLCNHILSSASQTSSWQLCHVMLTSTVVPGADLHWVHRNLRGAGAA
jgi:hypothetical protein